MKMGIESVPIQTKKWSACEKNNNFFVPVARLDPASGMQGEQ
jgi:hypothetical protein